MRRQYIVTVDVGWNDRDRPDDMRTLIERALPEWYNPVVSFTGVVAPANTLWECDTSPGRICVFGAHDTAQDDCIYCHQPQERK